MNATSVFLTEISNCCEILGGKTVLSDRVHSFTSARYALSRLEIEQDASGYKEILWDDNKRPFQIVLQH